MSPYRVFYQPLVEIQYRAWWVIKMLNFDITEVVEEMRLQLSDLEQISAEALRVLDVTNRGLSYSLEGVCPRNESAVV